MVTLMSLSVRRAWIEMTVAAHVGRRKLKSLSVRRAWIEICMVNTSNYTIPYVALRKESVDRNASLRSMSVSALVALRKESVDRNEQRGIDKNSGIGRSP